MSRDAKRTWSEQVEEVDNDQIDLSEKMKPNSSENSKPNSRENSNSRKKSKPNSDFKQSKPKKPIELETDPGILQRRQKQIDYGKNTVGYANFTQQIPLDQRTKEHPKTPDKYTKYSRRGWDMLIKIWRKKLHEFDSNAKDCNDDGADDDVDDDDINGSDDIDNNCIVLDMVDEDEDNPIHSENR